jgi:two-component system NtrC family sensor kinase
VKETYPYYTMKNLFCLFIYIIVSVGTSYAQDNQVPGFHLNEIPPEGILLDKGWIFQAGDNPYWANPDFDDHSWQRIDPTLDILQLKQIPETGICWFRLHLLIDSNFLNKDLVIALQQSGASEIFLNGKFIHQFGVIDEKSGLVKAYNPLYEPISFPISHSPYQLLAVRYALQPGISYSSHWGTQNKYLNVIVNTGESAFYQYEKTHTLIDEGDFIKVGVYGILCILYFAFYLFYPAQKVYLFFSIFAFQEALVRLLIIFFHNMHQIEWWFALNNFILTVQVIGHLFLLLAVYRLLEHKNGFIYYSIMVLGIISIPVGAYIYGRGWLLYGLIFTNLINIDIARLSFISVRNNKKGAWIIASGAILFLLFWILFSLSFFQPGHEYHVRFVDFFTLARLSIPISVAFYLGYDFALTNRTLQQKLTEVNKLSIEKQQILAIQNETLEKLVTQRTGELSQSLSELKETQSQLIQREKMASLGELTAGIAHEIQNPLNFVNNFSELNEELVAEMKSALQSGHTKEAIDIANDIGGNLEKINHHGKRADAIVKGMLQHSRVSTGQKEFTDMNVLADEILRLSYYGLRGKDKTFNINLETDFDQSLGKINIDPQGIGRVLLNIYNNAFYAVMEKGMQMGEEYRPTVLVSTKKMGGKTEIKIRDNGPGIPQKLLDKIFQPFYTTKPTGQGTGLGLSLSYDIITGGHGGELYVKTKEGEYAEFIILLPG